MKEKGKRAVILRLKEGRDRRNGRNGRNGRNEVEEKEKERYEMIGIDRPLELESGLDHAVLKRYEMNGCWMSGWAVVNSLGVVCVNVYAKD